MFFLTHADVAIDAAVPIEDWPLSERGRARIAAGLAQPWLASVTSLWSSLERKSLDTADIIADRIGCDVQTRADLGENDRSSTGYLPRAEFERTADRFFAEPETEVRGWASAAAEQRRIVGTVAEIADADADGVPLIVSHGAVGALLLAHLRGAAISRRYDQPQNGGGNWFRCGDDAPEWQPFDIVSIR